MTSLNTFDLEMTCLVPVDEVRNVQTNWSTCCLAAKDKLKYNYQTCICMPPSISGTQMVVYIKSIARNDHQNHKLNHYQKHYKGVYINSESLSGSDPSYNVPHARTHAHAHTHALTHTHTHTHTLMIM